MNLIEKLKIVPGSNFSFDPIDFAKKMHQDFDRCGFDFDNFDSIQDVDKFVSMSVSFYRVNSMYEPQENFGFDVSGSFSPKLGIRITIELEEGKKFSSEEYKSIAAVVASTISHELSHVAQMIHTPEVFFAGAPNDDAVEYYNHPLEVDAFACGVAVERCLNCGNTAYLIEKNMVPKLFSYSKKLFENRVRHWFDLLNGADYVPIQMVYNCKQKVFVA